MTRISQSSQQKVVYKKVRTFDQNQVKVIKRIVMHFANMPEYKQLLMILNNSKGPFSRLEIIAGLTPEYTDPRTGLMTLRGKRNFDQMVRNLNQDKYESKYPFIKVYGIPHIDENEEEVIKDNGVGGGNNNSETNNRMTRIIPVRYYMIYIYGKNAKQVIAHMKRVIAGLEAAIRRLENMKAVGANKIRRELQKYKQQIEVDQNMIQVRSQQQGQLQQQQQSRRKARNRDSAVA